MPRAFSENDVSYNLHPVFFRVRHTAILEHARGMRGTRFIADCHHIRIIRMSFVIHMIPVAFWTRFFHHLIDFLHCCNFRHNLQSVKRISCMRMLFATRYKAAHSALHVSTFMSFLKSDAKESYARNTRYFFRTPLNGSLLYFWSINCPTFISRFVHRVF